MALKQAPDRNLALELVRVTEAAAMAAGRWVGRGDKNGADGVAVNAMRVMISTIGMDGVVVIGEGEKDNAPMLYNGERVGDGTGPECDVAVDPIDGTTLTAKGMTNAVSVLAVAPRGTMYDPSAVFYMEKLVTGPEAADVVDIRNPVKENIHQLAKAKGRKPEDVTVVVLDRPRHQQLVEEIRATGARIKFITDGDVAGAIMAAREGTGIDLLLGIGGTPEGIIAATAMKCVGGIIQGRTSQSLVMRSRSGTVRLVSSEHRFEKLSTYARVTEAAAMAAARWVGRGDKNGADGAAVNAMRTLINSVSMRGVVVIGEGEKDHAPMLFNGEEVGDGTGPAVDVAVDPIDGTRLCATGMPNAVSVLAVAERGSMYDPSAVFYMTKLATGPEAASVVDLDAPPAANIAAVAKAKGPEAASVVDLDAPPAANIAAVAKAKGITPHDVTVVILDRPRHEGLIKAVRAAGARIHLITDGDVAGAIMAARPDTGIDLRLGIGGTPEGIVAACALNCMGGVILGKLAPRDDAERHKALDAGHDLDRVLTTDDLVSSEDCFFAATGITDGELMAGVRYKPGGATTHSLVMRSRSGTIRSIRSEHALWKLSAYSTVKYD